jgi:bloom syndrome protein
VGFQPIREAKSSKSAKARKGLGDPITSDERMEALDDLQLVIIDGFLNAAKGLRRDIMVINDHREPIFSDTVLREMCLELPMSLDEMRAIPGIRDEMVDRYGKKFLPLIGNTKEMYGGNLPKRKYLKPPRKVRRQITEDDDDQTDQVVDPNHENVINLISEDEAAPAADESESNYFSSDEDDDDDEEQVSHHFHHGVDPEVEAFNNQMSQLGPAVPKTTARAPAAARGGSKAYGGKKGRSFKRTGSGSFGKTGAGVKKRASKGSGSRASGGVAASKKAAGGKRGDSGGGGTLSGPWSRVMAMPT